MRKKTGKRSWIFQVGPDPGHSRTMYLLILGEKKHQNPSFWILCMFFKSQNRTEFFSPKMLWGYACATNHKCVLLPCFFFHGGIQHDHHMYVSLNWTNLFNQLCSLRRWIRQILKRNLSLRVFLFGQTRMMRNKVAWTSPPTGRIRRAVP